MVVLGIDPGAFPKWPREVQIAYLAALLDGEGYIGIKKRNPTVSNKMTAPKYSIAVQVSMTDPQPVAAIANFCGEGVIVRKRKSKTGTAYKPIYVFEVENKRAANLLEQVQPFLLCKREACDNALAMQKLREASRAYRTKEVGTFYFADGCRAAGSEYKVLGLSDDYIERCERIYLIGRRRPNVERDTQ